MQNKNKKYNIIVVLITIIAVGAIAVGIALYIANLNKLQDEHFYDEVIQDGTEEVHEVHNHDNYLNIPVADSNRELAEIISSLQGVEYADFIPVVSDKQETYESTVNTLGIDINDTIACAMTVDNADDSAYAISIFKVKADKISAVEECLNGYINNKKEKLKDNEEAKNIVDNAIVVAQDDYVSIIMCNNSEEVKEQLLEKLKASNDKINESIGIMVDEGELTDEASKENEQNTEENTGHDEIGNTNENNNNV